MNVTLKALAMFALAGALFAQGSGSISGTVKDSNGGVVAGAAVTAMDPSQAVNQVTHTQRDGDFVFPQLPPGSYTLTVESPGFKKAEQSNVVLPISSKVNTGDIVLQVGSLTETITVAAEAGQLQIQSESGERSNVVTNRQLRDIGLNGRNI